MIIENAVIDHGVIHGLNFDIFHSEFLNSEFSGNISGTLYNVRFEGCVFKDVIFEMEKSEFVDFVECRFENCIFSKRTTGISFILCRNSMNGIRFR